MSAPELSRRKLLKIGAAGLGLSALQLDSKHFYAIINQDQKNSFEIKNKIPYVLTDLAVSQEELQGNLQRINRMAYVCNERGSISSLYALRADSSVFRSSYNIKTGKQEAFTLVERVPLEECLTLAGINNEGVDSLFVGGYTADENRFAHPGLFATSNAKDYQQIPLVDEKGKAYQYGSVVSLKPIPDSSKVLVHSVYEDISSYGIYDQKNNSYDHVTGYDQHFPLPSDLYIDPANPDRLLVSGLTYDGMSAIAITELEIDLAKPEVTWAVQHNEVLGGSSDIIVERGEDGFAETEHILATRLALDENNREFIQRSIYTISQTDKSVFDYGDIMDNRLRDNGIEGTVYLNAFTKTDNGFWLAGKYLQEDCLWSRPLVAYFPERINPPAEKIVLNTFDDIPSVYSSIFQIDQDRFETSTSKSHESTGMIAVLREGGPVFLPSSKEYEPASEGVVYLAAGLEKGPIYYHYNPSEC